MKTEKERIIDRIRKMLRLASDAGATEGERENALRMAHATLAKYNLDIAMVEESGGKVEGEERGVLRAVFYGRPWARQVANAVAELFFCSYICSTHKKAKMTQHCFVGRQSNAITAREMSAYLVESIIKEGRKFRPLGNAACRSFAIGAAISIRRRVDLLIEERSQEKATPGTSLVLASLYSREAAANKLVFDQAFPKTQKTSGGKDVNSDIGYAAGREYGQNVSFDRQVSGSRANGAPAAAKITQQ
jgi:Protein of unknown function (DUF2786)